MRIEEIIRSELLRSYVYDKYLKKVLVVNDVEIINVKENKIFGKIIVYGNSFIKKLKFWVEFNEDFVRYYLEDKRYEIMLLG